MCGSGEGIKGGQMSQELRSGLYISTAKNNNETGLVVVVVVARIEDFEERVEA